jgi:hypothetical protein
LFGFSLFDESGVEERAVDASAFEEFIKELKMFQLHGWRIFLILLPLALMVIQNERALLKFAAL